ncbi:MAG: leucine-rich repeat domain-containing protein [Lachnospira sp.]
MPATVTAFGTFKDSEGTEDAFTWELDSDGKLIITKTEVGTGEMQNWIKKDAPWYGNHANEIKKVVINDGVTYIGEYAFFSCTFVKSVTIPASVETIGAGAFEKCTSLTKVTFKGTTPPTIGANPFYGCTTTPTIVVLSGSEAAYVNKNPVLSGILTVPTPPATGSDNSSSDSSDDSSDSGNSDNSGSYSSDNLGDRGTDNTTTPSNSYVTYEILNGAASSWTPGSSEGEGLTIRGAGDFDKFTGVKVDGILLDPSFYTATSGSTIITFSASFLAALQAGNHTVQMLWTDGTATTSFTINSNELGKKDDVPKTGDNTPIVWLFMLVCISGTGLILTGKRKKSL